MLHSGDMSWFEYVFFFVVITYVSIVSRFENLHDCASIIQGGSQTKLDYLRWRSWLESHLLMHGIVICAWDMSAFLCSFAIFLFGLQTHPPCCVEVGGGALMAKTSLVTKRRKAVVMTCG